MAPDLPFDPAGLDWSSDMHAARTGWILTILLVFSAAGFLSAGGPSAARQPAVPRIGVRDGRFVEVASGRPFHPGGFNYIRLRGGWHGTFAPQSYDAERAEAMLADLAGRGFNTVRVFIDNRAPNGIVASTDAEELSPQYMANFLDFLGRASRHKVYVIPSLVHLPMGKRYREIAGPAPEKMGGVNRLYLHQGDIDAKARYAADFVAAIKRHDPDLLPAVFAYELDNETYFMATRPPFSLTEGTLTPADGKTYDLSSQADLQEMADSHVVRWADACLEAIRAVDPQAMVSTSVFTFRAVGRSGPGRLRADKTRDGRFPARPLALARSKLSYLDVHFYSAGDEEMVRRDLESIEFEAFHAACAKAGKPMIVGEFGSFKAAQKTVGEAAAAVTDLLEKVRGRGFVGFLYWTYDTDEQAFIWNARSQQGEILEALTNSRGGWGRP
jgi:hypothetical protein